MARDELFDSIIGTMSETYETTSQFVLPHIMDQIPRHWNHLGLPHTQGLLNSAAQVAEIEIEAIRRNQPVAQGSARFDRNPFRRYEVTPFYTRIAGAISRAASDQMASAFTTQEVDSDR